MLYLITGIVGGWHRYKYFVTTCSIFQWHKYKSIRVKLLVRFQLELCAFANVSKWCLPCDGGCIESAGGLWLDACKIKGTIVLRHNGSNQTILGGGRRRFKAIFKRWNSYLKCLRMWDLKTNRPRGKPHTVVNRILVFC